MARIEGELARLLSRLESFEAENRLQAARRQSPEPAPAAVTRGRMLLFWLLVMALLLAYGLLK